jgi:nucleotide-binding universal stress UspA family protein
MCPRNEIKLAAHRRFPRAPQMRHGCRTLLMRRKYAVVPVRLPPISLSNGWLHCCNQPARWHHGIRECNMSYKTVLVHVDESTHASERIKIAAAIASAENAHLIGIATTGASRYLAQTRALTDMDPNLGEHLRFLRERAERGLQEFDATARKIGIASFEKRLVDDEAGGGICLQARYADLVVIGQSDPHEISPVVMPDFPQYVVLHSGRPVLLVPHSGRFDHIGHRILIGWDASMAASRAISAAIPLLRRAHLVQVAVFNPPAQGAASDTELALYLARQGIKVEMLTRTSNQPIGGAVLTLARELNTDLIVTGGYGHARFREIMLGGVTREVLESMTLPVLMAH